MSAMKINNLIVALWLNILCKRGGVKWRNYYQRATLTHAVAYVHFHIPEFIDPEN